MKKNIFLMLFTLLSFFITHGHALSDQDYQLVKTFHDHFNADKTWAGETFAAAFKALALDKQQMVLTEKLKDEDGGSILLTNIMTNRYQQKVTQQCADIAPPKAIEASLRSITSINYCYHTVLGAFLNKLDAQVKNDLILKSDGAGKSWWEQVCDTMSSAIKKIEYGKYPSHKKIISFNTEQTDEYFQLQILFLNHLSGDVDKDDLILGQTNTVTKKSPLRIELALHNPLVYATFAYKNHATSSGDMVHQQAIIDSITTLMASLSSDQIRALALQFNIDNHSSLKNIKSHLLNGPLLFYAIQKQESKFVAAMVNSIANQKLRDELILKTLTHEVLSQKTIKNSPEKKVYHQVRYNYSALSFAAVRHYSTLKTLLDALSEDAQEQAFKKNDIIDFIKITQNYSEITDEKGITQNVLTSETSNKTTDSLTQIPALFYIGSKILLARYVDLPKSLNVILSHGVLFEAYFPHNELFDRLLRIIDHGEKGFNEKNPCPQEKHHGCSKKTLCPHQVHKNNEYCKSKPCPQQVHKTNKYCKSKPCPQQVHNTNEYCKSKPCSTVDCTLCKNESIVSPCTLCENKGAKGIAYSCALCQNDQPPIIDCMACTTNDDPQGHCEFCTMESDESLNSEATSILGFIIVCLQNMNQKNREAWIIDRNILGVIPKLKLSNDTYTEKLSGMLSEDAQDRYFAQLFTEKWGTFLGKTSRKNLSDCLETLERIKDKDVRSELMVENQVLSFPADKGATPLVQKALSLLSDSKRDEAITTVGDEGKNTLHWAAGYAQRKAGESDCFELLAATISDTTLLKKALEQKDDAGQTPLEIFPEAQVFFDKKFGIGSQLTTLKSSLETLGQKLRLLNDGLKQLSEKLKPEAS